jgi:TrmH family RNA methyltransferase
VYASVLDGENIFTMDQLNEGMIIIGNESRGIGKELLKISRHKITIPKRGKAESLNAAIAAGIILSQFLMSGSSPR